PVLTISNGFTFLVSELDGSIKRASDQGLYSHDTRYLSGYEIYIDGKRWVLLNSGAVAFYASRIHLANPVVATEHGKLASGGVGLVLSGVLGESLHEDIDIRNYGTKEVHFILEVSIRSDFADIFEVKSQNLVRRGHIESEWKPVEQELATQYSDQDFRRCLIVRVDCSGSRAVYANGRLGFAIDLPAGGGWHACFKYDLWANGRVGSSPEGCMDSYPK